VTDENIFIIGALATPGGNTGLDFLKGHQPVRVRKKKADSPAVGDTASEAVQDQAPATGPSESAAGPKDSVSLNYKVTVDGKTYEVTVEDDTGDVTGITPAAGRAAGPAVKEKPKTEIKAPMPGNVYQILFDVGDTVTEGETLLILEAMKMETPVQSPVSGRIASIPVVKGQTVQTGQVLLTLEA
jgi:pyruvate carboxylase subunit B